MCADCMPRETVPIMLCSHNIWRHSNEHLQLYLVYEVMQLNRPTVFRQTSVTCENGWPEPNASKYGK